MRQCTPCTAAGSRPHRAETEKGPHPRSTVGGQLQRMSARWSADLMDVGDPQATRTPPPVEGGLGGPTDVWVLAGTQIGDSGVGKSCLLLRFAVRPRGSCMLSVVREAVRVQLREVFDAPPVRRVAWGGCALCLVVHDHAVARSAGLVTAVERGASRPEAPVFSEGSASSRGHTTLADDIEGLVWWRRMTHTRRATSPPSAWISCVLPPPTAQRTHASYRRIYATRGRCRTSDALSSPLNAG
jgi:hypothetical protein